MNEENRITLILIDTCAFRDANSDFPGIAKSLLPSFFSTADEKGICIDCEGASIREIDEEELSVRVLREDKGYPRRNTK